MSLQNILLGLLDEPHSGYDIKQHFDQVFRHFWSAELAQIYPALNRLEKNGLASSRQQASDKGPDRRVYRRTAAGTREHRKWLRDGPTVGKDRLPYLTQVYFLDDLTPTQQLAFFKKLRGHFADELEELRGVEQFWSQNAPGYPDQLTGDEQFKQFTLRLGLKKIAAIVEWCDECSSVIARRKKPAAKS